MDTRQVSTGQSTEQIEQQMSETRARIDRKLDALTARTAAARQQALWALATLIGAYAGMALWIRQRRHRAARRHVYVS